MRPVDASVHACLSADEWDDAPLVASAPRIEKAKDLLAHTAQPLSVGSAAQH
jgi:hypothetical protein